MCYRIGNYHTDEPLIRELEVPIVPIGNGKTEFVLRISQDANQDWSFGSLFANDNPENELADFDFDTTRKHLKSCFEVWADQIADALRQELGIDKSTGPIFEIDAADFSDFNGLILAFNFHYIQHIGGCWGGNLDAFNDYLCWIGRCKLRWINADKSKADLGVLFDTLIRIIRDNKEFVTLELE